ncbi:MAG: ATP-dependent DNA ligase, partial [Candidatus Dormibacteria bacterium]
RTKNGGVSVLDLPVPPPVAPMLASLVRELPAERRWYEPKWDGFRCIAFRDGSDVLMTSRNQRSLQRYFPEISEALSELAVDRLVIDGEIVATGARGLDFASLMLRLHPVASRVERLRHETPARFVAFDLLAYRDRDLRRAPLGERRRVLNDVVTGSPRLSATPLVDDASTAREWLDQSGRGGIDGVVAKDAHSAYEPGRRSAAWLKVTHERTLDCVVAGYRRVDNQPLIASLLLALYDEQHVLRHIGVSSSFRVLQRRTLFDELQPHVMRSLAGHPWERGFALERGPMGRLRGAGGAWDPRTMSLDWVPVRPERVCEVGYDHVDPNGRFRHPARFRRWRPDREPESCTYEQLSAAATSTT